MTEYIRPFDSRIYDHWKLKDFEWHRIVTSGELPAYHAKTGHRLVDRKSLEHRTLTEKELAEIEKKELASGKSPVRVALRLNDFRKPLPIIPPNTELFYFDPHHVKDWLFIIVFKMDDVLAFEAKHGIIIGALQKNIKTSEHIEQKQDNAGTQRAAQEERQDDVVSSEKRMPEHQTVEQFIKQSMDKKIKKELIALELKEVFKWSYLEIARGLELGKDLQQDQIDAIKQRARRLYLAGKKIKPQNVTP